MPIKSIEKDPSTLTMTVIAEFDVPVGRLWDAYADPRQLEKFWGPPEWPATFNRHDMHAGGRSDYYMTGPDGEKSNGYWEFLSVDPGKSLEVRDGFSNPDGSQNSELPSMTMTFNFEAISGGSRVTTVTRFASLDDLQTVLGMGMEEGLTAAMGQMDAVLADLRSFAAGSSADLQFLSDTEVRVSRIIRGSVEQVWKAHNEADLMRKWMLGPDGWTMPVCEIAGSVGESYRYEWVDSAGENRFGFTGELLESETPVRAVSTERMVGTDGPSTVNELTLTPVEGGTLLTLVIVYPSLEVRDAILATGMVDGMEASYVRLESVI